MQLTTERPQAPPRVGFIRRNLLRADQGNAAPETVPSELGVVPSTVIDLREDLPAAQWRGAVSERLERLEAAPAESARDDEPFQPLSLIPEPSDAPELLPAAPFELEPVEEQFVPMDDGLDGPDARKIWGLEA